MQMGQSHNIKYKYLYLIDDNSDAVGTQLLIECKWLMPGLIQLPHLRRRAHTHTHTHTHASSHSIKQNAFYLGWRSNCVFVLATVKSMQMLTGVLQFTQH